MRNCELSNRSDRSTGVSVCRWIWILDQVGCVDQLGKGDRVVLVGKAKRREILRCAQDDTSDGDGSIELRFIEDVARVPPLRRPRAQTARGKKRSAPAGMTNVRGGGAMRRGRRSEEREEGPSLRSG